MKKKSKLRCTEDFVKLLQRENEIIVIEEEIDPNLELAKLQREVSKRKGPALLFTNVSGTSFPVATNLYGSERRLDLAFGERPFSLIKELVHTVESLLPPSWNTIWQSKHLVGDLLRVGLKNNKNGPVLNNSIQPVDFTLLPQIKSWPEDGGAFVTLPLVYTESPTTGQGNLGMYRVQMFDPDHAGMHIQIMRGGGFHYHEAEKLNQPLPASLFIGGPPAMTIAAIAPLPENVPELLFASLLMGEKLTVGRPAKQGTRIVMESDFCIRGFIPPKERKAEGPFGDHYGYYSLKHDFPFLKINSIHHRDRAIYPATVVGRPPQEDHYIAEYLQELISPLFPLVMSGVKNVWAYEESGVHSLAGAVVKNRYPKEAFTAALRILGEGHLSLTKFLLVTDQDCNPRDFKAFFSLILERADLSQDLFVLPNISQDTLDYTNPRLNRGSKAILLGLGEKKRNLPDHWEGTFIDPHLYKSAVFCPGALCVEGSSFQNAPLLPQQLSHEPSIQEFSMVFLLDDCNAAVQSPEDFLWHVFTRFDPASDIHGKSSPHRFSTGTDGPAVIDCRLKPWYPKVLEDDPEIAKKVTDKWGDLLSKME